MLDVRGTPLLIAILVTTMSLGTTATHTDEAETDDNAPEMITLSMYGGTITLPADFEAGERFLQLVEPPTFTRTEQALEQRGLQPGDRGDQGGEDPLVLERRHTDYSYMNQEWTGGMRLEGVSGTSNAYICICDATFVMTNETGLDPTRPIRTIDSQYLWFDNLTIYGGSVGPWYSQNIIVSNSLFIDSSGVRARFSDHGYVHNISVIRQRPPTNVFWSPNNPVNPPSPLDDVVDDLLEHSPIPLGRDFMCWPHVEPPPCEGGGVILSGGSDWTIEWSYFHGAGGAGTTTTQLSDLTIRHNTFRDTALGAGRGDNEISWNLIRGNGISGTAMHGCGADCHDTLEYHNNSLIMPFQIDHRVPGIEAGPGAWLQFCDDCNLKHNDFIGYGLPDYSQLYSSAPNLRYPALLSTLCNHITANDNYWGTLHDPRIPDDWWIRIEFPECTSLNLDRWETQPIHDITPLMYTFDTRDIPYWIERTTDIPAQDTWDSLFGP